MPDRSELPHSIAELSFWNGIAIRPDPDFVRDAHKLIRSIDLLLPRTGMRRLGRSRIALTAVALLALIGLLWNFRPPQKPSAPASPASVPAPTPSSPPTTAEQRYRKLNMSASTRKATVGEPTGLVANEQVIWDSKSGRVWARDIFLLGTTKELFKASEAGTATISQDLAAIDTKAEQLTLGGLSDWHLATADEMQTLKAIDGSALFLAFATRRIAGGATNLIGIYRAADGNVAVWGYQYANYLQGPYDNHWYQGNDFGVWLAHKPVANLISGVGVRSLPERRTEERLKPILTGLMVRKGSAITGQDEPNADGFVGNLDADDRRTVFIYSLKTLGRGVLVQAEVVLAPVQASGMGTVAVSLYESNGVFRPDRAGDWGPRPLNVQEHDRLTWDGKRQVRLTLPEHVVRNIFNGGTLLGLHFQYTGKGDLRFEAPALVITYIKDQDLLQKR